MSSKVPGQTLSTQNLRHFASTIPQSTNLIIAQLHYENAQLKDEHEQMCSMLLDIAYHATTPKQQRGEIILFLSLFDSGRTAIEKRQRQLDEQGRSQDALVRIASVRDSVENLAHLALNHVITEQTRVGEATAPTRHPLPTIQAQIRQRDVVN